MFSPHGEIRQYLDHCVEKYQLNRYIHLSHRVLGAIWSEEKRVWDVQIEDTANQLIFFDHCHFLMNAGGILNNWRWPSIPGLQDFRGKLVHSANWPSDWDYRGLKVAVIGNGSTGIQIVPAIQPQVKELVHLIRSPTWVTPGAASRYPSLIGGRIPERFSDQQKEHFRNDPAFYLSFRKQVEREINGKFRMLVNGSDRAEEARINAYKSMVGLLGPHGAPYVEKVVPGFPVGCRRITPGIGYLESFTKPNVQIVIDATIEKADEDGLLLSNGEHIQLDAIVCATGFDVSFTPRFPIIGRDGISLKDVWSKPNIPYAYLSMAIPKFPNYFSKFNFTMFTD
jgi:cation diffusion facilitator CzcD-associated flavoprotein CzcO